MWFFTWPTVISLVALFLAAAYLLHKEKSINSKGNFKGIISDFTIDLTKMARDGKLDPVVGRDVEIRRLTQVLSRRRKNNAILYGKAGIGKTAIIEGLAIAISKGQVPSSLANKVILKLDLSSVLAGTKYRGDFEQRFKALIDSIIALNKQIIVFIDEIHTIVQAGGTEGGVDADDIIKAPLARGELQMVGATTTEEYFKYIASDQALLRRFEDLFIAEPDKSKTRLMLRALKKGYEDYHNVLISDKVIAKIVELTAKQKNRSFPDKAIDLMDEVSAKVRLDHVDSKKKISISEQDVASVFRDLQG